LLGLLHRKENLFIIDERQKIRLAWNAWPELSIAFRSDPSDHRVHDPGRRRERSRIYVRRACELARLAHARARRSSGAHRLRGAALGAMVGWMTYGKRKFDAKESIMRRIIPPLDEAMRTITDDRRRHELRSTIT